jgi:1-acyl-sn-glycerol-3-phosphate acyltransferase
MNAMFYKNGRYESPETAVSALSRTLPSFAFHIRFLDILFRANQEAKHGRFGEEDLNAGSLKILRALEASGVRVDAEGTENFIDLEDPCIFVANHMSTLETMIMPWLINPYKRLTFVVKDALVKMPVFRHALISLDPIVVGRKKPREDIQTVLARGRELLALGTSIVLFPQASRLLEFDPKSFNKIGVKLAAISGVPIIPTALKTDAWANGRLIKSLGKIDPHKKVHFAFGRPINVSGRGAEEHERIIEFIQEKLMQWNGR